MADLSDVRAGFMAALKLRFPDAQVTGYLLENPYPPAFEVEIGSQGVIFDMGMQRGTDEWWFTIRGFAGSGTDKAAQERLDVWLSSSGSQSVKEAVEVDRTLSGSVDDCRVTRISQLRSFSPISNPGMSFFGAEWTVRVIGRGDT